MTKNIIKEITGRHANLLILSNEKYVEDIYEVAKQLANRYERICYVNLNKPYDVLIKDLTVKKIDVKKFYFIDTTTKALKQDVKDIENVKYVSSPNALTELSLCISDVYKKQNSDCILFDSLSTLLVYQQVSIVTRFAQSIITKMASNTTRIFTVLEGDTESVLVKNLGMFVDKVIYLGTSAKKGGVKRKSPPFKGH